MSAKIFLDTNVLVYAYSTYEPVKKAQAQALIASAHGNAWLSSQVLIEFVNVSHRKMKASWPDIQIALIELTASYEITETTPATIATLRAWRTATAFRGSMRSSWPPPSNAAATRCTRQTCTRANSLKAR